MSTPDEAPTNVGPRYQLTDADKAALQRGIDAGMAQGTAHMMSMFSELQKQRVEQEAAQAADSFRDDVACQAMGILLQAAVDRSEGAYPGAIAIPSEVQDDIARLSYDMAEAMAAARERDAEEEAEDT